MTSIAIRWTSHGLVRIGTESAELPPEPPPACSSRTSHPKPQHPHRRTPARPDARHDKGLLSNPNNQRHPEPEGSECLLCPETGQWCAVRELNPQPADSDYSVVDSCRSVSYTHLRAHE